METYLWIHLVSFLICAFIISFGVGSNKIKTKDAADGLFGCLFLGPLALLIAVGEFFGRKFKDK